MSTTTTTGMSKSNIIRPLEHWTLDHIHAIYEVVMRLNEDNSLTPEQWFAAVSKSDSPLLKNMPSEELSNLCAYIHQKVEGSRINLKCFMNEYESTQTELRTQVHENLRNALENFFFSKPKVKKERVVQKVSIDIQTCEEPAEEEEGKERRKTKHRAVRKSGPIPRRIHSEEPQETMIRIPLVPLNKKPWFDAIDRFPHLDLNKVILNPEEPKPNLTSYYDKKDGLEFAEAKPDGKNVPPFADIYKGILENKLIGKVNDIIINKI